MPRKPKFALTPGRFVLHLSTLALTVTMVLLGRWQLNVSNAKHFSLQNFGYAVQWWVFSAFVVAMWARIMLDTRDRSTTSQAGTPGSPDAEPAMHADDPVPYRRYVMPQSATTPDRAGDAEHAAYNDYLARLDADSSSSSGAEGSAT